MNLTFILHFDGAKVTDSVLVASQIKTIHEYCIENKFNLLVRQEFYHDATWSWNLQTLKLVYDYLWDSEYSSAENKIDAAVIIRLTTNPAPLVELLAKLPKEDEDWSMADTENGFAIHRVSSSKEYIESQFVLITSPNPIKNLTDYCKTIGLVPRTLIEVGAAHPDTYRLGDFVNSGYKVILVEANPRLFHCLKDGFNQGDWGKEWPTLPPPPYQFSGLGNCPNVTLIHAAITDKSGIVNLFERNASSFVEGVTSPACINDSYIENQKDAYQVPAITIDSIDDGTIDVLLADCEGSEWFCLKHLKSRPKLIILELQGQRYINPYFNEIFSWLKENGYAVGNHGVTDSWFYKT